VAGPERKRELGRGERTLPGVWRLRLPLPWPGVPHGNAWVIGDGDGSWSIPEDGGFVLVDTGIHEPDSMKQLERALDMVGLELERCRLLVCTHAHSDHYGQAATIVERTGCELWMHPNHEHMTRAASDPDAWLEARLEVARHSGVPEEALARYREARKGQDFGVAGIVPADRDLMPGVEVETGLGTWQVIETPGHAPSHVCLFQPERRLLISGDHLLGRVSLYYDYGYTEDPAGEFLTSLDAVDELNARLCLPGHGRTFTDVRGHVRANRELVNERVEKALDAIRGEELTALEVQPHVHGQPLNEMTGNWWLSETLCYLRHLEVTGRARRDGGDPERWSAA
jgi:glyoxylase-like metal-dependent hydrolase (beta-lactamase superfamily II)